MPHFPFRESKEARKSKEGEQGCIFDDIAQLDSQALIVRPEQEYC
jgi:hypothetical protein